MSGSRPRLYPALFTIAVVLVCGGLGLWQLQRLEWKRGLIAQRNSDYRKGDCGDDDWDEQDRQRSQHQRAAPLGFAGEGAMLVVDRILHLYYGTLLFSVYRFSARSAEKRYTKKIGTYHAAGILSRGALWAKDRQNVAF